MEQKDRRHIGPLEVLDHEQARVASGEEFVAQPEAPKAQIIDLLEALKRSVASVKKADNDAAAPPAEAPAAAEAPPPSESPGPKKAEPREKKSKKKAVV